MKRTLLCTALAFSGFAQASPLHVNVPDLFNASGLSVVDPNRNQRGGIRARTTLDNGVADAFTVAPGGWTIGSIDFFAFRTDVAAFSFTTATWSVRTRDGSGVLNNLTFVHSMGATAVADGGRVGYRVDDTNPAATIPSATDRAVYLLRADVADFYLPAGAYWLTWSLDAGLNNDDDIWVPYVFDDAPDDGGRARLLSNDGVTFSVIEAGRDEGPVSLPFILNGPTAGPTANSVPEPSSAALVLLAGAGLLVGSRRQRGRRAAVAG